MAWRNVADFGMIRLRAAEGHYLVATVPDAPGNEGAVIYVQDANAGSGAIAYSDGTIWRDTSDNAALA